MTGTYDPKKVIITFGGLILSGFAEGKMVTVKRKEDMWSMQIGVDGEGARSKSNNKSGEIEISLLQTSASNEALSALALSDENSNSAALPFAIKDISGASLFLAETAWIKKYPDAEYTDKATTRTWMFETDLILLNVAGN